MFKVHMVNFKSWPNLALEFNLNKITLIKGVSGSGKSSIVHAIIWCLFKKIEGVEPWHLKNAQTKVTLEFPYKNSTIVITRQKHPNHLSVIYDNITYETKQAQAFIVSHFGSYERWMVSSYVGQKDINAFFGMSSDDKLETLNVLSFRDEDPKKYLAKITNIILETENQYNIRFSNYNTSYNQYKDYIDNIDESSILSTETVSLYKNTISEYNSTLENLYILQQQRDMSLKMLNTVSALYDDIIIPDKNIVVPDILLQTSYISTYDTDTLNFLQEEVIKMRNCDQKKYDLDKLKSSLNSLVPPDKIYTQEDYDEAVKIESQLSENISICKSCNIEYSPDSIEKTIFLYEDIIDNQNLIKKYHSIIKCTQRINDIDKSLSSLNFPIDIPQYEKIFIAEPDMEMYDISELNVKLETLHKEYGSIDNHIKNLEKGTNVLSCPHCQNSVYYIQGKLINADVPPTDKIELLNCQSQVKAIQQTIDTIQNAIKKLTYDKDLAIRSYRKRLDDEQIRFNTWSQRVKNLELDQQKQKMTIEQLEKEKQSLLTELENLNVDYVQPKYVQLLSIEEIKNTQTIIFKLRNIKYITPLIVSSKDIKMYLLYQDLSASILDEQDKYNKMYATINLQGIHTKDVEKCIVYLKSYIQSCKFAEDNWIKISMRKENLGDQITTIKSSMVENQENNIELYKNSIIQLQNLLNRHELSTQLLNAKNMLSAEKDNLIVIKSDISKLYKIKQCISDTECEILQQTVDSIDSTINTICQSLFSKDITVRLNLYKTIKSTQSQKQIVNFSALYKGGVIEKLKSLSGGEGDRVSLSVTFAIHMLSGSKLLILDETLAGLDQNFITIVLKTIRNYINSTVLIIMHNGVEGIYDEVLDVNTLTN